MPKLPHALSRSLNFSQRGPLRLLYEPMQHHDAIAGHRAIEHPCDAFRCLQAKLEQTLPHGSRVRHPQVGSMRLDSLAVPQESGEQAGGQRQELLLQPRTEELDPPWLSHVIADLLYAEVVQPGNDDS
jgi:hypothetical protein